MMNEHPHFIHELKRKKKWDSPAIYSWAMTSSLRQFILPHVNEVPPHKTDWFCSSRTAWIRNPSTSAKLCTMDYSLELNGRFLVNILECGCTYLLLAECEVCTASFRELSFFLPFMAQARSAWAMKTRKEKTRIHNLPYGPSKRG